jgi:DNA-binding NarL/FixJ family response regulator
MRTTRILVVDDHPVVHQGVRLLLERAEHIEIVGEAASGAEAIRAAASCAPDLVLLDLRLPDMLPDELIRRLSAAAPATRIVIFTAHASAAALRDIAGLGVHGFIAKDTSPARFVDALTRLAAGQHVIDLPDADQLARAASKLHAPALTHRELEVLRRAARGESNGEIAAAIFLAPTTVKSYLQSALHKLDARNRAAAVAKLSELELL